MAIFQCGHLIDSNGLVTVLSTGITTITATSGPISGSATLQVANPNRPPIANAGPDQTVVVIDPAGAAVSLNGTGSTDPDGNSLNYIWFVPFGLISGINLYSPRSWRGTTRF